MDIDFCLSSPQEFLSMTSGAGGSGGTGCHEPPTLYISSSTSTDFNDASSDDGEQLQTPVNAIDPQQLIHIAYPPGLGGPLVVASDSKPDATGSEIRHVSRAQTCSFATPPKNLPSPYKDFLGLPDPSLRSSPLSEPDMFYTKTLLDSKSSFNSSINDTSLELYSNYASTIDVPQISHTKNPGAITSRYRVFDFDSPSSLSKSRKRAPSNQSPLSEGHSDRRPKYSRAHASEYLPSTLGSSYSTRFPTGHRLRSDFVRKFRLEAELGAGGYGFVMAAQHRYDGQEVAVKFILKDKIPKHGWSRDDTGRRVPKEAMLLSIVSHSGIVKFYDLFEDNEYFYLVQELHGTPWQSKKKIDSQTLQPTKLFSAKKSDENQHPVDATPTKFPPAYTPANTPLKGPHQYNSLNIHTPDDPFAIDAPSLLPQPIKPKAVRPNFARRASHDLFECIEQSKHKRFDEKDAKYVFAQLVEVVEYLDSLGISHCDLKDENVVIDKDLKIKIIDFGSVVFADPKQPRPFYRRFFGTAAYASPEIIDEKPYQAAPAEIWALGVLLSYLVTGLSPFRSEEDKRKGRIVLEEAHGKRISPSCYNLLQKCLEVDPEKRATIREVKAHSWFAEAFNGECSRQ